ncbi:hypothetical protein WH47_11797 [Habropoda laboriosa]|uniref:Uncharacterized protein n=1 Tax=Habropoda laboriosa TaxID=597456 RepID=A0A0L7R8E1_9HYME|nr:hypothetical protein WH47_11797 [Habropoda laboriosa]
MARARHVCDKRDSETAGTRVPDNEAASMCGFVIYTGEYRGESRRTTHSSSSIDPVLSLNDPHFSAGSFVTGDWHRDKKHAEVCDVYSRRKDLSQ